MNEKPIDGEAWIELDRLLKPDDIARVLDISRSLAYRLLKTGDIPSIRFGASVRVRAIDLEEFVHRSWSGWKRISRQQAI